MDTLQKTLKTITKLCYHRISIHIKLKINRIEFNYTILVPFLLFLFCTQTLIKLAIFNAAETDQSWYIICCCIVDCTPENVEGLTCYCALIESNKHSFHSNLYNPTSYCIAISIFLYNFSSIWNGPNYRIFTWQFFLGLFTYLMSSMFYVKVLTFVYLHVPHHCYTYCCFRHFPN